MNTGLQTGYIVTFACWKTLSWGSVSVRQSYVAQILHTVCWIFQNKTAPHSWLESFSLGAFEMMPHGEQSVGAIKKVGIVKVTSRKFNPPDNFLFNPTCYCSEIRLSPELCLFSLNGTVSASRSMQSTRLLTFTKASWALTAHLPIHAWHHQVLYQEL